MVFSRRALVALVSVAGVALSASTADMAVSAQADSTVALRGQCDFDGDGYDDLAVGAPLEGIGLSGSAGAVNVLYGTANGLTAERNQMWHQGSAGIPGGASENDDDNQSFGEVLSCGDFNGDGHSDLAIGVPEEDLFRNGVRRTAAGAVNVIYGSPDGLGSAGAPIWHQGSPGVRGSLESFDEFGRVIAAGDFDGDGFADLAISAPGEALAGQGEGEGVVHVLFGTPDGLTPDRSQHLGFDETASWKCSPRSDFGAILVSGDFDGDSRDDLVIGSAQSSDGPKCVFRAVMGGESGLETTTSFVLDADKVRLYFSAPFFTDVFADSGDVDGDGFDDFVVVKDHKVIVWSGNATGPGLGTDSVVDYSDPGVPGDFRSFTDIAVDDMNGDGIDDILFGSSKSSPTDASLYGAGKAVTLFGSSAGIVSNGSQLWHQDVDGVAGKAQRGDEFGRQVHIADFDGDGFADGVIGAPLEGLTTFGTAKRNAGMVHILPGAPDGLTTIGSQHWHQARPGIAGGAETGDWFGDAFGS